MKCENCNHLCCMANESERYEYCDIFGEDVPDIFCSEEGCNLKYAEAKKLGNILAKFDYCSNNFLIANENVSIEWNNYIEVLEKRRKKES